MHRGTHEVHVRDDCLIIDRLTDDSTVPRHRQRSRRLSFGAFLTAIKIDALRSVQQVWQMRGLRFGRILNISKIAF